MPTPNLWLACITAFCAVAILLSILAAMMRLILVIFPEKEDSVDTTILAAIASVARQVYPGTKITKVEELR